MSSILYPPAPRRKLRWYHYLSLLTVMPMYLMGAVVAAGAVLFVLH